MSFFLLLVIISRCSRINNQTVNIQSGAIFTLIDSTTFDSPIGFIDYTNRYSYYPVYFIGKVSDTIILGKQPVSMFFDEVRDGKYEDKRWMIPTSENTTIAVDTSRSIVYAADFLHFSEEEKKEVLDSSRLYKAFLVTVTNISDSLLSLGTHNFINWMIREAKDRNGQWIPIENRLFGFCGTAKRDLIIEPGNIAIAKLLRYKGTFKTQCRLKIGIGTKCTYSNTFVDYIDDRQLQYSNMIPIVPPSISGK